MKTISSLILIVLSILSTNGLADDYEQQQQTQIMQQQLDIQRQEQADRSNKQFSDSMDSIAAAIRRKRERRKEEQANQIQAEATAEAQRQQQYDDQQNTLKALSAKLNSKYDEYVVEIENINIDRESLGMSPRKTLNFQEWQNPKGYVANGTDVESVSESVENRIRYSDYVLSYEKLNVKRKRAKLQAKKIGSYLDWCKANSIPVPAPAPIIAQPDLPPETRATTDPPQNQGSNYRDSDGILHIGQTH